MYFVYCSPDGKLYYIYAQHKLLAFMKFLIALEGFPDQEMILIPVSGQQQHRP